MKKPALFVRTLLVVLQALLVALAAAQEHVKWSAELPEDAKPNSMVEVLLKAEVEEGWYLYSLTQKEGGPLKTVVDAVAPLTLAGTVKQPAPTRKFDANFEMDVEFFKGTTEFKVPVHFGPTLDGKLSVRFQVCDDTSCMPPKTLEVPIAAAGQVEEDKPIKWSLQVPTDAKPGETITVKAVAKLGSGWHLYSLTQPEGGPFKTTIAATDPLKLAGEPVQPQPVREHDPNFGIETEFFKKEAVFEVPVTLGPEGLVGALQIRYQICNETTCMPPTTIELPLDGAQPEPTTPAGTVQDPLANSVAQAKQEGLLAFIALSFGAGLLALLTPCVFPMVPITVSYFSKRRESQGSKVGLTHALAYCLGIVGAFTGFGLLMSAFFGASSIQLFATNPWVNVVLGLIFVFLALNLFGVYQISLPAGIANKFSPHGKSGLIAPILMGLTFTLTSFTCTVPFVGTILVSAAQGEYFYPLVGMLAFGSAFAIPFFLLALFPQYLARLPKSGSWLETTKAYMGFIEIAAAIKFFSNADLVWGTGILPRPIFLGTWAVIFMWAGLFLLGILRIPKIEMPPKMGRGRALTAFVSVALAVWFATAIPGRSLGEMEAYMPPSHTGWLEDYEKAVQLSRTTGKPILINFTGVTCTNCRWMEKNMFTRDDVQQELQGYVTVELFTDRELESDRENQALQVKLVNEVTLPAYVAVTPEGEVLRRGSYTRSAEEFVQFLKDGRSNLSAKR